MIPEGRLLTAPIRPAGSDVDLLVIMQTDVPRKERQWAVSRLS